MTLKLGIGLNVNIVVCSVEGTEKYVIEVYLILGSGVPEIRHR